LVVPGLIGNGETFENMKGWVSYMNNYIQHTFNDLELKFYDKLGSDLDQV
jgi:hypothetical protein